MRVHPSQLSHGILPFFGPSNFWVKSFNLNNKKIVVPVCLLFLFSVLGSALNEEIVGNIQNKIYSLSSTSVNEPLAVILTNGESRIFLLSAPTKLTENSNNQFLNVSNLELTTTEKIFLEESKKFGTLSVSPLSEPVDYPLLEIRSVKELKGLLESRVQSPPTVHYEIQSRVFVPGQSEIYGITDSGTVVEIGSDGKIIESAVN